MVGGAFFLCIDNAKIVFGYLGSMLVYFLHFSKILHTLYGIMILYFVLCMFVLYCIGLF